MKRKRIDITGRTWSRDDRGRNDQGDDHDDNLRRSDQGSDDQGGDDQGDDGNPLHRLTRTLARTLEGEREAVAEEVVGAVERFARTLEAQRSRRPPVPPREQSGGERRQSGDQGGERRRGDAVTASRVVILGDGRDMLYRRAESRLSGIYLDEYRASRNPRQDELARQWAHAINAGDVGARVRLYHEMNDGYLRALGMSRASLLEGSPTGENPLSDGSGAELLPLPLAGQLMVERNRASVFRGLVNSFPMTAQVQRVPVLPTVTATSRAENAAYTDNTPAADAALLTAHDIGVMFSAGRNFLEDTAFNIVQQLTVVAGGAIGEEEDVQIATSTANGADITEGLDAATITDVAETTTSSIGWQDFVKVFYSLPKQYRRNACWFAAGTTLSDVALIADTTGRPVLSQFGANPVLPINEEPGAVGMILGKRVFEVPVADDVIYFGDPMWYALGDRARIRVDTDRAVSTGNRQWVIDERIDGRVIPTSAVGTNNAWRKVVY